jgi:serine phosphatase RsbU (regulator of sigma subunit)
MAVAVTVLRTLARHIVDPAEILSSLNDELLERNPRRMFVTMQCLVFDLEHRRVSCAGAISWRSSHQAGRRASRVRRLAGRPV